jgi:hypothetical protein
MCRFTLIGELFLGERGARLRASAIAFLGLAGRAEIAFRCVIGRSAIAFLGLAGRALRRRRVMEYWHWYYGAPGQQHAGCQRAHHQLFQLSFPSKHSRK